MATRETEMKRTALAMWQGNFRKGHGSITLLDGGISDIPFSYKSRFEGETALSPEGLLAAAHAASFAMSFAKHLDALDVKSDRIDTVATVKVEEVNGLDTVTRIDLELVVHTHSCRHDQVREAAKYAASDCTISRLINAEITLVARIAEFKNFSAA